ncbi:hypothetical protein [Sodalis-like endosymbiont of Proechinophthirus fluctus]
MEGNPCYQASQEVPDVPYAGFENLGIEVICVDDPADLRQAWATALAAD